MFTACIALEHMQWSTAPYTYAVPSIALFPCARPKGSVKDGHSPTERKDKLGVSNVPAGNRATEGSVDIIHDRHRDGQLKARGEKYAELGTKVFELLR